MDVQALRWFQLVVDGATVTEVAELHMVSQPGVSRALRRLDDDLGVELLYRRGRLLRPTHPGVVFKRHVDAMLHRLDDGLAALSELVDPERGRASIAFQSSLGTWLVPTMIAGFKAEHPDVTFDLEPSADTLHSAVAEGRVDLEFTSWRSPDSTLVWHPLLSQALVLAVPRDHPLTRRDEVDLAEASDEVFIGLHRSWYLRSRTDELCAEAGFEPNVAFEADDLAVVVGFVAAGLGVAVVPAPAPDLDAGGRRVKLVRIASPRAFREVGLVWSTERPLLPTAGAFRDHVMAMYASR